MNTVIMAALTIFLVVGCSTTHKTRTPSSVPADVKAQGGENLMAFNDRNGQSLGDRVFPEGKIDGDKKAVIIRIRTMEQFLRFVDLERLHISGTDWEKGSIGLFLASPETSLPSGVKLTDEFTGTPMDAVGYFFTHNTELNPHKKYSASKYKGIKASHGETGSGAGWPCGTYKDKPMNDATYSAVLDYSEFNGDLVSRQPNPQARLRAMMASFRLAPMSKAGEGNVQTGCYPKDGSYGWSPRGFDVPSYSGDPVQAYAIFKNYKKGDIKKRKADAISIFGNSFGGHFVWERSIDPKAKVKNSLWLIDQYEKAGYKYIKYK